MNTVKTILGYILSVGSFGLQVYLTSKGVDPITSASILGPMTAVGSRLLQRTTPKPKPEEAPKEQPK